MDTRKSMHIFLLELLEHVYQKTREQEKICVNSRSLFRPWPKKGDRENEERDAEPEKNSEVEPADSLKSELSIAEQHELNLLQELLSKAEKAREVQRKANEKKRNRRVPATASSENRKRSPSSTQSCEIESQICKSTECCENNSRIPHCTGETVSCVDRSKKNAPILKNSTKHNAAKAPGVIKQTDLNRLLSESKRTPGTIQRRSTQPAVFLNAPFKTDPNSMMPKKRPVPLTSARSKARTHAPSRASSGGRSTKSVAGRSSSADAKIHCQTKLVRQSRGYVTNNSSSSVHEPSCVDDAESQIGEKASSVATPLSADSEMIEEICEENFDTTISNITEKIDKLKVQKSSEKKNNVVMVDDKPFNLIHDGKRLPIPLKLRKLLTENLKLKCKLHRENLTKKIDAPDFCVQFMSKLESQFEVPENVTRQKDIQEVTNTYHNLLSMIEDLKLKDITDEASTQNVLKIRKYLEFILNSFYDMEQIFADLSKNIDKNDENLEVNRTVIKPKNPRVPPVHWLPRNLSGSCALLPSKTKHVQYSSRQELEKYYDTLFQLQYLLLQKELMNRVSVELVPMLEKIDPQTREFIAVFQPVYALLCREKLFPVIIRDTISNAEQSSDDAIT